MPPWEHLNASFDIKYLSINKNENIHLTACKVREHLQSNYPMHLKVYADGSVLDSSADADVLIPDLKRKRNYHLGEHYSIFTAELYAIYMTLTVLNDINRQFFVVLI